MNHDLIWLLSEPLFWAISGIFVGPYLFVRGFQALLLKRQLVNIPLSNVRAAAMGSVRMSGKAVGPYTVPGPLSGDECLYYRLVVVEDSSGRFSAKPKEISAPLFLDDGTGRMLIYPVGAELRMKPTCEIGSLGRAMSGMRSGQSPDFVQEFSIRPGDDLLIAGTLQENVKVLSQREACELARIGREFISESEASLLWQSATGLRSELTLSGRAGFDSDDSFNLCPQAILASGRGPFIISKERQSELTSRLSWRSVLFIWGGALWTLWSVSKIAEHSDTWKLLSSVYRYFH